MAAGLLERAHRLLPGLWAGWLLCTALQATPAPFATLAQHDAGRVVGRMLAQDAYTSLALGVLMLVVERVVARRAALEGRGPQFSAGMVLALVALFCTVAGYFGLQPMMAAARSGQGALSFGQLHAVSAAFYAVKVLAVVALAWRATAPRRADTAAVSSTAPSS